MKLIVDVSFECGRVIHRTEHMVNNNNNNNNNNNKKAMVHMGGQTFLEGSMYSVESVDPIPIHSHVFPNVTTDIRHREKSYEHLLKANFVVQ